MFIVIYFINDFEHNDIFLFRCLHRSLVTSRTVIEKITNIILFNKYNVCKKKKPKMKNNSDIFGCSILVYVFSYKEASYI